MYFQLTELRSENEDLKTQVEQLLNQQAWFANQITLLQNNESNRIDSFLWHQQWLEEQLSICQQHYGESYNNWIYCCQQLVEARDQLAGFAGFQPVVSLSSAANPEWSLMLEEDLQGLKLQTKLLLEKLAQESHEKAALAASAAKEASFKIISASKEAVDAERELAEKATSKWKVSVAAEAKLQIKCQAQHAEIEALKKKLAAAKAQFCLKETQFQQRETQFQQKIAGLAKDSQEKIQVLEEQVATQKDLIRQLQTNVVTMTEKLADANNYVRTAKNEVHLATDLSNGLSDKCLKLQRDHQEETAGLSKQLEVLKEQLEYQKQNNLKLIKRAVDQQKTIKKLSKQVTVQFNVDKETTEQVISESYQDLQKFIQEKQTQLDQTLALVAYALVHMKFVLEMYCERQSEQSAGESSGSSVKEFFAQLISHVERVFLVIPVHVMLKNVDRLSDLASSHGISIKVLHFLQYQFPKSAEDAIASRQRAVLDNFPELSSFFLQGQDMQGSTVTMSARGFMMLMGMSK